MVNKTPKFSTLDLILMQPGMANAIKRTTNPDRTLSEIKTYISYNGPDKIREELLNEELGEIRREILRDQPVEELVTCQIIRKQNKQRDYRANNPHKDEEVLGTYLDRIADYLVSPFNSTIGIEIRSLNKHIGGLVGQPATTHYTGRKDRSIEEIQNEAGISDRYQSWSLISGARATVMDNGPSMGFPRLRANARGHYNETSPENGNLPSEDSLARQDTNESLFSKEAQDE